MTDTTTKVQHNGVNISLATKLAIDSAKHATAIEDIFNSYDNGNITEDEMLNKLAVEAYRFLDYIACKQRDHNQMDNI